MTAHDPHPFHQSKISLASPGPSTHALAMTARCEAASFGVNPLAHDLDPDRAFNDVELLDPDPYPAHSRMPEHDLGHVLGDGLDEIDMPAPGHQANGVEDHIVGEDRAHVVGAGRGARHQSLDIEHDALRAPMLALVGAEVRGS